MTDNQIQQVMAVLTRLSIAFERIADQMANPLRLVDSPAIAHNESLSTASTVTAPGEALPKTGMLADPPAQSIPYDTVRAAINAYADSHGEHATQTIIKRFGATYIKDLKAHPELYPQVLEALK